MLAKNLMSNVTSWDEELFASGLEDVGSLLSVASFVTLIIGILFLGYRIYQDIKEK